MTRRAPGGYEEIYNEYDRAGAASAAFAMKYDLSPQSPIEDWAGGTTSDPHRKKALLLRAVDENPWHLTGFAWKGGEWVPA